MTKVINTPYSPIRGATVPLFPIKLFRGTLPLNHDMVAQSIRNAIEPIRESDSNTQTNYTTYFNQQVREEMFKEQWFMDFSDMIKDTYVAWLSEEFGHDFSNSCRDDIHLFAWANQYHDSNYHESHNHPNTIVSGTYYVKVNQESQPIKFYNPNPAASIFGGGRPSDIHYNEFPMTNMHSTGYNETAQEMYVHPVEGEFLLWPSYMYHSVPFQENTEGTDYERISFSFNLHHKIDVDNNETGRNLSYDFLGSECG